MALSTFPWVEVDHLVEQGVTQTPENQGANILSDKTPLWKLR